MSDQAPLELGAQNPHGAEAHRSENRVFWLLILANVAVLAFIGLLWGARVLTDLPEPGTPEYERYLSQMEALVEESRPPSLDIPEFNRRWKTQQVDIGREIFAVEGRFFALAEEGAGFRLVLMGRGGQRLNCYFAAEHHAAILAMEGQERLLVRGLAARIDGREGLHLCRIGAS
jgi:hypothetical protein